MRGEGIPEEDISRAVEEATQTYQAEGRHPDPKGIKKELNAAREDTSKLSFTEILRFEIERNKISMVRQSGEPVLDILRAYYHRT